MRSTVLIAALLLTLSSEAMAQEPATVPGAKAPIRTLMGDLALVLRDQGDGTLSLGVAGAARSVLLTVRASDARRWADSVSRLAVASRTASSASRREARARTGGAKPNDSSLAVRARAVLEEPGVGAGTLQLTRLDSAGTRTWSLFADDAELAPLRATLEPGDAVTLARLVRRAVGPAVATPRKSTAKPRAKPTATSGKGARSETPRTPGTPATARRVPPSASPRPSR